jgi:ribose transport system ATP-binding protein
VDPVTDTVGTLRLPGRGVAPSLAIRGLSKTFGDKTVLDSFTLELAPGEIHFLLGQNGSGKSTLIKILSGYHEPDPGGQVFVGGTELKFGSAASSHQLGCRFVHQDLGLVETSSVLDNLFISATFPTRAGTIRRRAARAAARAALDRVELDVDPEALVSALGAAERTGVAVARALLAEEGSPPHVLVLDEPTATLPVRESEQLRATVRAVAASGVSILYVTHHLDEVTGFADRVTVLRDGALIDTWLVAQLDRKRLIHQLIGTELEAVQRLESPHTDERAKPPVLTVEGLRAGPLDGLSFRAWGGEVTGLCGLTGSGRETVLAAIFGARPRDEGQVTVNGQALPAAQTKRAIEAGVGYLPPDRRVSGGIMDMTAQENLTLVDLKPFWNRVGLSRKREAAAAGRWFEDLDVRPRDGLSAPLSTFSGGNQQKVLFGKWLRMKPKLLLLDEPTQGVDVGAKAELHRHLLATAKDGTAVVVSSTDIEELVTLCSRVLVIRDGRIADEFHGDDVTAASLNASFHAQAAQGTKD